jgi:hypothetical protein
MLTNEEDETTFFQNVEHQPPNNTKSQLTKQNPHPAHSSLNVASQVSTGKTTL